MSDNYTLDSITLANEDIPESLNSLIIAQPTENFTDYELYKIDQALMKKSGIIGPPAILFFDRRGNEMRPYRLVGYFTAEEFSAHLQQVLAAP